MILSGARAPGMTGPAEVSFCATNLNTLDRLPASLDSIERIGVALARPFEIVVADGPSDDGARAYLKERADRSAHVRLVPHTERNRGYGRRLAFEASVGATIVPFDTSIAYGSEYAELLRAYLRLATDRMLFSEICALPRSSVTAVGGWRDLVGGEDIDLYARAIRRFGVIAYPTGRAGSQSRPMSAVDRQMRYVRRSRLGRVARMYAVQRDQIVGANYRVRDLMGFNRRKPWFERVALRGFFTLAFVGSRLGALRPIDLGRNNYLVFRDALLESIVRADYRALDVALGAPLLLLTADEREYLSRALPRWAEYAAAEPPILGPK